MDRKKTALQKERQFMIDYQLRARGIHDEKVLKVMAELPREAFIHEHHHHEAYGDHPLPIGENQTISQPYMVALMTQELELKPADKVLELGTGSGYQAAILAKLVQKVYSIERHLPLIRKAEENIKKLNIKNIEIIHADGSYGYEKQAPYNKIIVTAACSSVPKALVEQLADNGILVIPVGNTFFQELLKIRKKGKECTRESVTTCVFVPLVGEYSI